MNNRILLAAAAALLMACSQQEAPYAGFKTEPLPDTAWACSQWISAVDAPVVTGKAASVKRAADGASWFVASAHSS